MSIRLQLPGSSNISARGADRRAGITSQLVYRAATGYRCFMPISVTVLDDVVAVLKLPPRSVESDLRKELALRLRPRDSFPWPAHAALRGGHASHSSVC